jgi:Ribosomal protein L7/L12 C-terminal domain
MSQSDPKLIIFLLVAYVLLHAIWPSRGMGVDASRLARLEFKVNKILDHLGIDHDIVSDGVKDLIQQGRKIAAIKLYREQNGTGLKESKDAVEKIAAELKTSLRL